MIPSLWSKNRFQSGTAFPIRIGAVRAALRRVEEEILRDHVAHCVAHAISSGDKADQRSKVAELLALLERRAG